MQVIREMTAEEPDLRCRDGLGSSLSRFSVLRQSATNLPLLLRHVLSVAAFPPRQLPRVFKTARAAAIGRAVAELVARAVAGIVVVDTSPELALVRASRRSAPHSRFSSRTPPAVLAKLYHDFERTLRALVQEVERLAVPILWVNGADDARANADRIIGWTRMLHGRQLQRRPEEVHQPAGFSMSPSPRATATFG
jgi:pimeloyl-ACP methyl ester carboxylesterase